MGIIVKQARAFDLCKQAKRHIRKLETVNRLVNEQVKADIASLSVKTVVSSPETPKQDKQVLNALNALNSL